MRNYPFDRQFLPIASVFLSSPFDIIKYLDLIKSHIKLIIFFLFRIILNFHRDTHTYTSFAYLLFDHWNLRLNFSFAHFSLHTIQQSHEKKAHTHTKSSRFTCKYSCTKHYFFKEFFCCFDLIVLVRVCVVSFSFRSSNFPQMFRLICIKIYRWWFSFSWIAWN